MPALPCSVVRRARSNHNPLPRNNQTALMLSSAPTVRSSSLLPLENNHVSRYTTSCIK